MENEGLADGAPVLVPHGGEEVEKDDDGQTQGDADNGEDWADQEHHPEVNEQPEFKAGLQVSLFDSTFLNHSLSSMYFP